MRSSSRTKATSRSRAAEPAAIPARPGPETMGVVWGTELKGFFSPPATPSGSVDQYTVQWDTDYTFKNVEASGSDADDEEGAHGAVPLGAAEQRGAFPGWRHCRRRTLTSLVRFLEDAALIVAHALDEVKLACPTPLQLQLSVRCPYGCPFPAALEWLSGGS